MRFQWYICREAQKHFEFKWAPAALNRADYPSKHHPSAHHKKIRAQGYHVAQHAESDTHEQIRRVDKALCRILSQ